MKTFCLGFVVNAAQSHVLLLQKRSTDPYNPSVWNGVGGKLEAGETALQAMVREVKEEANLDIPAHNWLTCDPITDGATFRIDVFTAAYDLSHAQALTDEPVCAFDRNQVASINLASNVENVLGGWMAGSLLVPN